MKGEMNRDRGDFFTKKNVSGHSNQPDELAQNVSKKKIPVGRIIPPCVLQKCRIWPFFSIIYMIRIRFFGPRELNQNYFSGAR